MPAGTVNSIGEVVKERPIYIRERAAGLSAFAYLSSKVIVLCAIAAYQAAVITAVGVPLSKLKGTGALLGHPFTEVMLAAMLLEIALTCLGLLLSALMTSPDIATNVIVLVTMVQLGASGALVSPAHILVYAQASWFAPARWGMAAFGSTANLNSLPGTTTDTLWNHTDRWWLFDMGVMLVSSLAYLLIAWWLLNRQSPGRRATALPKIFRG